MDKLRDAREYLWDFEIGKIVSLKQSKLKDMSALELCKVERQTNSLLHLLFDLKDEIGELRKTKIDEIFKQE